MAHDDDQKDGGLTPQQDVAIQQEAASSPELPDGALLHRIDVMLQGGYPIRPVQVACIGGRARGFDVGVLELGAELYHSGLANRICIPGVRAFSNVKEEYVPTSYPGPYPHDQWLETVEGAEQPGELAWIPRLKKLGVPESSIYLTPRDSAYHTRGDTDGMVLRARENGWISGVLIFPPDHILRAMLGLLKSFEAQSYRPRVWPLCPRTINWSHRGFGSQGLQAVSMQDNVTLEFKKIAALQASGAIAQYEELDRYLCNLNYPED